MSMSQEEQKRQIQSAVLRVTFPPSPQSLVPASSGSPPGSNFSRGAAARRFLLPWLPDWDGNTPWMLAAMNQRREAMRLLASHARRWLGELPAALEVGGHVDWCVACWW